MMNTNALAKHYDRLTPEERFRLILAAGGRGDEAERERLARAGQRITLSMQDHAPFAHAFGDVDRMMYLELLEDSARYFDAFARAKDEPHDNESLDFDNEADGEDSDEATDGPEAEEDTDELSPADQAWDQYWGFVCANGFILKTRADGWKLFCARLNVPPFLFWDHLPGFRRLQRGLNLATGTDSLPGPAFFPEGMVRFFNRYRPADATELTTDGLMTAEKIADELDEAYHQRVKWWGG
jgi:hypothetical protein